MKIQPSHIKNRTRNSNGAVHLGTDFDNKHSLELPQNVKHEYKQGMLQIPVGFLCTMFQSEYRILLV
jgi:hypothetical protein